MIAPGCERETLTVGAKSGRNPQPDALRIVPEGFGTAHGNCLRALVKHLDEVSDDEIVELNIPTGIPLVYELNDDLTPMRNFYLGDAEAVAAAQQAVAEQGKRRE